jgi:L-fuconolactonase
MPDFPLVDTHVHFIDPARHRYPEIATHAPGIHKPHLPSDFDRLRGGVEVASIVFVDVAVAEEDQRAEAAFAGELAAGDARIQAITAAAALERGASIEPEIAALAEMPLVRGIRRLIQNQPDPGFCTRPAFLDGVRLLARYGLHFEICIYLHQLGAALELARQVPEVPMLLDHIGKPGIAHDLVEPWWTRIRMIADLPHVHCKVSGVITEDDHEHWNEAHIRPFLARVFDAFGVERLMFGSDWPVSELTHRYADWVGILDRFTAGFSDDERRAFFVDNANAFYRMN